MGTASVPRPRPSTPELRPRNAGWTFRADPGSIEDDGTKAGIEPPRFGFLETRIAAVDLATSSCRAPVDPDNTSVYDSMVSIGYFGACEPLRRGSSAPVEPGHAGTPSPRGSIAPRCSIMWLPHRDDGRDNPPPVGEKAILGDCLDRYREALQIRCDGIGPAALASRPLPQSKLSLLGLVRHMAHVEHHWFRRVLGAQSHLPQLYKSGEDPDADFHGATTEGVAEDWASWHREVAHAQERLASLINLDATLSYRAEHLKARDVPLRVIVEYARHVGHADLLRLRIEDHGAV
jgi:hypothetical protein